MGLYSFVDIPTVVFTYGVNGAEPTSCVVSMFAVEVEPPPNTSYDTGVCEDEGV